MINKNWHSSSISRSIYFWENNKFVSLPTGTPTKSRGQRQRAQRRTVWENLNQCRYTFVSKAIPKVLRSVKLLSRLSSRICLIYFVAVWYTLLSIASIWSLLRILTMWTQNPRPLFSGINISWFMTSREIIHLKLSNTTLQTTVTVAILSCPVIPGKNINQHSTRMEKAN